MDIHEYQAKEILSSFGVTIPRGGIVYSPETAENKAREIGGSKWVVKAQIHSGARGKAGGIIVCNSPLEVAQATDKLLGKKLVTNQTGPEGKIVNRIYSFSFLSALCAIIKLNRIDINKNTYLPHSRGFPLFEG